MDSKGMYLIANLMQSQKEKVSTKSRLTSYYPFATDLPDKLVEKYIIIEVFVCCNCGKPESDNCDCNGYFEKIVVKIQNGK